MIKYTLFFSSLFFYSACSQAQQDCGYTSNFADSFNPNFSNTQKIDKIKKINPDSLEHTTTYRIELKNGDSIEIEHLFCVMYNLTIRYYSKAPNLEVIVKSINTTVQSAPVELSPTSDFSSKIATILQTKSQDFATDFSWGLDSSLINSNESIEHEVSYKLHDQSSGLSMVEYYLGVGGE